ncbi:transaldolase [Caloranaerobacter sp. TR13]|uniref:fructose-6-phosphate aldolase n=1 Tax=Caloranaerobacter sp. TR13 TaxID=1302151 RepID=UPI0006D46FE1|nr:fructose-6-phosphate aldolase [Caloranaerobacter sp. TR13]KPU27170.1 transaldolase [Caloranaerobacter sp. TR13]
MLYLLDTANLESIRKAYDLYPMNGVTTNPTIISKEKRNFLDILKDIRKIIGVESMLHVQVISTNAEKMVEEAEYLNQVIGGNLYIKIPVIHEGIKAMKILKNKGIKITATAIFTAQQALMAAKAGAEFVAPYVNRIDNISGNGIGVVTEILQLFEHYNLDSKVLAASFKNVQQVHLVSLAGAHSVTVNPEILDKMLEHPLTDWSVNQFINDWTKVYGKDTLTINVK